MVKTLRGYGKNWRDIMTNFLVEAGVSKENVEKVREIMLEKPWFYAVFGINKIFSKKLEIGIDKQNLLCYNTKRWRNESAVSASVAQLVEQRTENPRVVGSIPTGGTTSFADLAHLVERDLAKVEVAGSSPVIRSIGDGERRFARCRLYTPVKSRWRQMSLSKLFT